MNLSLRTLTFALLFGAATIAPALAAGDTDRRAMTGPALTCVPAPSADRAVAVATMDGHDVMLACKPTQMMMADRTTIGKVGSKTRAYGPNVDSLLTPGEIDAAWTKWTAELLHLDHMTP